MRIDLPAPGAWLALCDSYRAALPFQDTAVQVQLYSGYQHALWEVTQGLAKLFSHKKTIAIARDIEPAFEEIAKEFSQEGYTLKFLSREDLANPAAWFEEIQAELLFVLVSEDDPITGEVFNLEAINTQLKDKRVFRLILSHAAYKNAELARPTLYEGRILSFAADRALLVGGERYRLNPIVAAKLPWPIDESAVISNYLKVTTKADQEKTKVSVESFESALPTGFHAYFKPDSQRVFDRAVIYSSEFDGSSVIDGLAKSLGKSVGALGSATSFDTTSPCRWESPSFANWLTKRGWSAEQIRGLTIISSELISKDLAQKLAMVAKEISAIQNG